VRSQRAVVDDAGVKTPFGLLDTSAPESRRPGAALIAGLVAGMSSGAVKMGWEALLPPRKPDREIPPVLFLQQRGIDPDDFTYEYNGNKVPLGILAVHFGFSLVTVAAYSVAAEYLPKTKLWAGAAYGIGAFVVAHEIVLPRLGLSPKAADLPVEEHVSELLGHILWMLEAEQVRKAVRLAIAGVPDADTRVNAIAKLADTARAALRR
jgi:putative membrane protein